MNPDVDRLGVVASATLASASVVLAQDVLDGVEPSTGITAGLLAIGALVFRHLWNAMREDQQAAAAERRADDDRREAELERLRARVDELTDRLIQRGEHP